MFGNMNMMEMVILFGVAVLLFGKRLPEVGRTLGKGIVEFKKGIRGIEEEFRFDEHSIRNSFNNPEPIHTPSDLIESSVPKFEPPTAAPVRQPDQPSTVVTQD